MNNMKGYHETADGKLIALKDLTDDHLDNIIAMIERKAKEGIKVFSGGGHDIEEMWAEIEELSGKEVFDHFGYEKYKKEKRRRAKYREVHEYHLSDENKHNILETLLTAVKQDHPEFMEENTTGWDVVENAEIWLNELRMTLAKKS